ncbi:Cytochrome P450 [Quillaja saponaria]|uniref:Cytochrome P450 n=1 Tax=Quillaja saponaria TaxID=32244 RepID=A0AAD7PVR9_QUISA|nr:Cytochrome P450 [Quillaja saponaria]
MSLLTLVTALVLLLSIIYTLFANLLQPKQLKNGLKQPPGPVSLPVIGHLHLLGNLPQRALQSLAKKYGPIMSLRLGDKPTIVVSSPEAAQLFLKTHDAVFASRPRIQATELMSFGEKGIALTQYGPYWRDIRKLCSVHLFSPSKVEFYAPLRREEVGLLVESLKRSATAHEVVDLSMLLYDVIESITFKMIWGRSKDERFDMKGLIQEVARLGGTFNITDYVPWLGKFDLQGITQSMKKNNKEMNKMLETIMVEHEQDTSKKKEHHKDFIDHLLSLIYDQPNSPHDEEIVAIDRTNIKAIVMDLIIAAFETTATTLDWAFSELLRNPRVMKKLQQELENVVGLNKMVEQSDVEKLNYLDMVVKETYRLHPVAPFLIPHESTEDITVNGYYIKKNTRVIVNVWAIGRDPKTWSENVEEFYPERFTDNIIDLKGHDFELIPFGSGRRGCPGMLLGLMSVKYTIARLVHCFNWELPNGMKPEHINMNEKFGLSIPRLKHLLAKPTYRLVH